MERVEVVHALAGLGDTPVERRLDAVLRADARALGAERVSYWSFDGDALRCRSLYVASEDRFGDAPQLLACDYPRYLAALSEGVPLVATDAVADPRTRELSRGYLVPQQVGALLDVPIVSGGKLVGVVCHEHVGGTRAWSADHQVAATALGQMARLALEARVLEEQRALLAASPGPVLWLSEGAQVLRANAAAAALFAISQERLDGAPLARIVADAPQLAPALLDEILHLGDSRERELELERADGSRFWALLSARRVEVARGAARVLSITDISEHKRREAALAHAAVHDPLTGLANRVLFEERVRGDLERMRRRERSSFAVLYLDLDGFKGVNDTLGHDAGDRLLVEIGRRIASCLRGEDLVARLGGDEFAVVIAGVFDLAEARQVAARIEEVVTAPLLLRGRRLVVAASIGIAIADVDTAPSALVRAADAEMYLVKRARRTALPAAVGARS